MIQAHVDADLPFHSWQRLAVVFDAEADMPAPAAAAHGHALDLASDLAVPLDTEFTDALQVELAVSADAAAVAIGRKREGVIAIPRLETREARLAAALDAAKERLERLVESPQDVLAGTVGSVAEKCGMTR